MSSQVTTSRGVKIYNISAEKTAPFWLSLHTRKKKPDSADPGRYNLIHDFNMPTAVDGLTVTGDGEFIMGHGVYPPQIRCWELEELGLKFTRHVDDQIVKMMMLTSDYRKFCTISTDRHVTIHAPFGQYYKLRTPKVGRDALYQEHTSYLVVCGNGGSVFRLNLHAGRFVKPLETNAEAINKCAENGPYRFLSFGSSDGRLLNFDPRTHAQLNELSLDQSSGVSSLAYSPDGLTLAAGSEQGTVSLFDIRSSRPYKTRSMMNNLKVVSLQFLSHTGHAGRDDQLILAADRRSVKIIKRNDGSLFTGIESDIPINTALMFKESGFLLIGGEEAKVKGYYIPDIGPAPLWCSFLDTITQELEEEEKTESAFSDFRFVTIKELEEVGLSHLRGTSLLKAYLHGYFINDKLYRRVRTMLDEAGEREAVVKKERGRAAVKAVDGPSVNVDYSDFLSSKKQKEGEKERIDTRFTQVFEDEDFAIKEGTRLHKQIKENRRARAAETGEVMEEIEGLRRIDGEEGEESDIEEEDSDAMSEDENIEDDSEEEDGELIEERSGSSLSEILRGDSSTHKSSSFGLQLKNRRKTRRKRK